MTRADDHCKAKAIFATTMIQGVCGLFLTILVNCVSQCFTTNWASKMPSGKLLLGKFFWPSLLQSEEWCVWRLIMPIFRCTLFIIEEPMTLGYSILLSSSPHSISLYLANQISWNRNKAQQSFSSAILDCDTIRVIEKF